MTDGFKGGESDAIGDQIRMAIEVVPARVDARRMLDGNSPVHLRIAWELTTSCAAGFDRVFRLRLYAGNIGAGYAGPVAEACISAEPGRTDYLMTIVLPPGTLPGERGADLSGIYRIVGVLEYQDCRHPRLTEIRMACTPVLFVSQGAVWRQDG